MSNILVHNIIRHAFWRVYKLGNEHFFLISTHRPISISLISEQIIYKLIWYGISEMQYASDVDNISTKLSMDTHMDISFLSSCPGISNL